MWDILQQFQLHNLEAKHQEVDTKARGNSFTVAQLAKQLDKMALVNQALYEVLQDHLGITDEELRRKVKEVDQRDGKEDGSLSAPPLHCPKCKGAVTAGALKCLSCGATLAPQYPFEK